MAVRESVVELFDGCAVMKLDAEHRGRREPGDTAAKTNPNLHDQRRLMLMAPVAREHAKSRSPDILDR
jgi:hypothetical protein